MKIKVLVTMLALAMCVSIAPSYAAEIRQSEEADVLLITGNSFTPYENIPVAVFTADGDEDTVGGLIASGGDISEKVIFTGTATADAEGNLSYTVPMGSLAGNNIYWVYFDGDGQRVGFMRNSQRIGIVDIIVNAGDNLATELQNNYMYLSVNNRIYELCSSPVAIANVLKTELEGTTLSSQTEGAIDILAGMINKSALSVAANEQKLTSLADVESILAQSEETSQVIALMSKITDAGKSALLADFQGNGFTTPDACDSRFAKEIVLKSICYPTVQTSTELLGILETNNSVLGLNLTGFNALTDANKGAAIVSFSNQKPTVSTMQSTLDSIVSRYSNQSTPSAGGGAGGGGGGISNNDNNSFIAPSIPSASAGAVTSSVFNDLGDVAWAKDAILTLHANGIISGYGNKQFAPKNNIKREEFVQLVVGAYYPDAKADDVAFSDVASSAWYYNSLKVAVANGIISGIDEENFGAGMNITRQDMAVILYRVAGGKLSRKDMESSFADDGMISDYAKEAVYALRDAGIINGVSETEFAPTRYATRAETAVMLHRFMNSVGGGV